MARCAAVGCVDPFADIRIAGQFFKRRTVRGGRLVTQFISWSRRGSLVKRVRKRACQIGEEDIEKGLTGGGGGLIQDFVEVRATS